MWGETVNYLSADLILSPLLMILHLNLSAAGNKVFVKRTVQGPTFSVFLMTVYLQWLICHLIVRFLFFSGEKKTKKHRRNPVCRHSMRSEWFYLMHCELSGPPSGQFSLAWLGRRGKSLCAGWLAGWLVCVCVCVCAGVRACLLACVRARVCACREGRHCSLTSPLSPACRCSQTRLCYSEASTGDRPSAKHGAPPADLLERGAGCEGSRTHVGSCQWNVNKWGQKRRLE